MIIAGIFLMIVGIVGMILWFKLTSKAISRTRELTKSTKELTEAKKELKNTKLSEEENENQKVNK